MAKNRFVQPPARGENPSGFVALTPNGTASDKGDGQNHQYNYGPGINGPRWEMPTPDRFWGTPLAPDREKIPTAHRTRNINRTGE